MITTEIRCDKCGKIVVVKALVSSSTLWEHGFRCCLDRVVCDKCEATFKKHKAMVRPTYEAALSRFFDET